MSLAALSNGREPWNTEMSCQAALSLLSILNRQPPTTKAAFIEYLLRDCIKPAFSGAAKNPTITAQGRKDSTFKPSRFNDGIHDQERKPWTMEKRYVLNVFQWTLQNMSSREVEDQWPHIIPPILTLLDDESTIFKAKGCELLNLLFKNTSSALLARTGLGELLESTLMNLLSYLPPLTPSNDSVGLLMQAYPTLIALGRVRYSEAEDQLHMKFLDQVFRRGVLAGYVHCKEYISVVQLLVEQIAVIVEEEGLWSVRHLKFMIPILSDVLADPFGPQNTMSLVTAAKTMKVVVLNTWPRVAQHRAEILRGLTCCWCNIIEAEEETGAEYEDVKSHIRQAYRLLAAALLPEVDLAFEIKRLVETDGLVAGLLADGG
ncbi:MAG: hypothetical protein M1823_001934 [Watsoniomyces obsoletus]|nr:MAG: hypothetical protein M1823_001934 [Watsoniomyces obsoletus]